MNACVTFHPPAYVRDRLLEGFELLGHVPGGTHDDFRQDVWTAYRT
jgi:hypothetical protein